MKSLLEPFLAPLVLAAWLLSNLPSTSAQAQDAESTPAPPTQAQLEERLQTSLAKSVFVGRWSLVGPEGLGEAREEKYTLQGISKVGGNVWLVHARIQYGNVDATVPVPVKITWVEGTAIMHITDLAIPGVGTYTARVVLQGDTYAGTWSGGKHGGVMSGVIQREQSP